MTARIINTSLPYPGNALVTRVPLLAYLIDDDWSSMGQQRGGEEEWVGDSRESGKPSGARVLPRLPGLGVTDFWPDTTKIWMIPRLPRLPQTQVPNKLINPVSSASSRGHCSLQFSKAFSRRLALNTVSTTRSRRHETSRRTTYLIRRSSSLRVGYMLTLSPKPFDPPI